MSPLPRKLPALSFSCTSLPAFPTPKLVLCTICLPHQASSPCLHSANLPSPGAKVIRPGPPPLFSVSPPHVSPWVLQLKLLHLSPGLQHCLFCGSLPLTLLPPHTRHLYNAQISLGLLFTMCGRGCTCHCRVVKLIYSVQKDTLELYLHIVYISFTLISIHEYILEQILS